MQISQDIDSKHPYLLKDIGLDEYFQIIPPVIASLYQDTMGLDERVDGTSVMVVGIEYFKLQRLMLCAVLCLPTNIRGMGYRQFLKTVIAIEDYHHKMKADCTIGGLKPHEEYAHTHLMDLFLMLSSSLHQQTGLRIHRGTVAYQIGVNYQHTITNHIPELCPYWLETPK